MEEFSPLHFIFNESYFSVLSVLQILTAASMEATGNLTATGVENGANMLPIISNASSAPVTCLVDWDDDTTDAKNTSDTNTMFNLTKNYNTSGWYDVYMVCMGPVEFAISMHEHVYFGVKVTNSSIANWTDDMVIPITKQSLSNSIDPVIVIDIYDGTDLTVIARVDGVTGAETTPVTGVTNGTMAITLSYTWFSTGKYVLFINMSNPLGSHDRIETVVVEAAIEITSVSFQDYPTAPYFIMFNDESILEVTVAAGDNVTISLIAKNSNLDVIFASLKICESSITPVFMPFTLNETGEVTMSLEAKNYVSKYETSFNLTVVHKVNNITFGVSDPLVLFNEQVTFEVNILAAASLPMGPVVCTVTFGDGGTAQLTSNGVSAEALQESHGYSEGVYNTTCVCENKLPNLIHGEVTTMSFSQVVIVENPVTNLTFITNSPNSTHHPWSVAFTVTVKNSNPTDMSLTNITCQITLGEQIYNQTGSVTPTQNLELTENFPEGDKTYAVYVNCSNRQTFKDMNLGPLNVFYDCWRSNDLFDNAYKSTTTPIVVYTHEQNSVTVIVFENLFVLFVIYRLRIAIVLFL